MDLHMHGVPLIEQVIEKVMKEGLGGFCGTPQLRTPVPLSAQAVADLRMPGGKPISPSLRRWLMFDASWLAEIGWYADPLAPVLEGNPLSITADQMYGFGRSEHYWTEMFAEFEPLISGPCFPLVGGCDSRRLLYVGEPDSIGEYPVLVTDIDDMPYVAVMYPGLDVYLAHEAGVIDLDFDTYTSLIEHPIYGTRMQEHATHTGLGPDGIEIQDLYTTDKGTITAP
ncbi:hypothetical protein ABZV60_30350 [Streptomyces sp. NPDC004787]|uniref:hypothetical protein n=1 Tax=Streptomyces sp. NPDC004787 TaxID=3154291 RepID=UPI0033B7B8A4